MRGRVFYVAVLWMLNVMTFFLSPEAELEVNGIPPSQFEQTQHNNSKQDNRGIATPDKQVNKYQ